MYGGPAGRRAGGPAGRRDRRDRLTLTRYAGYTAETGIAR
jgi:hypothetical protein